ncbi:MAG: hypothetical protein UW92_C0010G0011 [Candidatus Jorgensenbacteria bacterium GW2011_GWA2_45_13]|uniref:Uncharacterized protein n=1 Tax=Candidatus Jorgensenbacteria bacterium GW2011_GWA2_45_13 TaxID=1618662 RepID=A0A0G1NEP1_9BACT|nr:MAG: hypothetical protein UW92_C0010G0011 [Candidatus Jorgensenbacteria bacterium GW2011_GWA2_45_13]
MTMKEKKHIVPSHIIEWNRLYEDTKVGKYKLPIRCVVVNGKNRGICISEIKRDKTDNIVIISDIGNIIVDEMNGVIFKYGKDREGTSVFVSL